ncbi:hypothetical protein K503DRAFT_800278 [Rhizopogon vinicolor AM-OR11-026]|uniref:WD40 repeat-like protein n=1 Tax=Rhizopogon vinicolor AM-OR11-026 TaxID=1314800 RepID=A0A1B7N1I5_9AGAM|nr:hypothetical protein K503DRAFT_800278 [Rhizopogon vinicolor AM-OR11-026]
MIPFSEFTGPDRQFCDKPDFHLVAIKGLSAKFDHHATVLSCLFGDSTHAYSGCLDTGVCELDLSTEKVTSLGQHSTAVSALSYAREIRSSLAHWTNPFVSGILAYQRQKYRITLPEQVYHMDIVNNTLVVSMASRLIPIYNVRRMSEPAQTRESSLKFTMKSLACMADGQGYAIGSVEGRIGVEYFDPSPEAQEKKYAFKYHEQNIEDVDHV